MSSTNTTSTAQPNLHQIIADNYRKTQERILNVVNQAFEERVRQETARRQAWVLEEAERLRRMRLNPQETSMSQQSEDKMSQVQAQLLSSTSLRQVNQLEEQERYRRLEKNMDDPLLERALESLSSSLAEVRKLEEEERVRRSQQEAEGKGSGSLDDKHEQVQQEFMKAVHTKETAQLEEAERKRRAAVLRYEDMMEALIRKVEDDLGLLASISMEEKERKQRMDEYKLSKIYEAYEREISRRKTWFLEEKERHRRMMDVTEDEFENSIIDEILKAEVIAMEEQERQRRIKEVDPNAPVDPALDEKMEQVKSQFMSHVHEAQAKTAEENERMRRILEEWVKEAVAREVDRRVSFVLEERERVRRILEDADNIYTNELERRMLRNSVIAMEEKERERRIREMKTHAHSKTTDTVMSQQQDRLSQVQRDIVGQHDKKEAQLAEEEERKRRLKEAKDQQALEEDNAKFESKLKRQYTRALEQREQERRITEQVHSEFKEKVKSELHRREAWRLEEQERLRRMGVEAQQADEKLKGILSQVNEQVKARVQKSKVVTDRLSDETIHRLVHGHDTKHNQTQ